MTLYVFVTEMAEYTGKQQNDDEEEEDQWLEDYLEEIELQSQQ